MDNNRTQPSFRSMDVLPPKPNPNPQNPSPNPGQPQAYPAPVPTMPPRSPGVTPPTGEIPLAQQSQNPAPAQPGATSLPHMAIPPGDPDKELDHIMGEVDAHGQQHGIHKPKRQRPILIAVITLLVAVALAVVAVFAFHSTQKVSPPPSVTDVNSGNKKVQPITSSELDTLSKSIDTQMNGFNDTKDFASSDVTDQALGL